MWNLIEESVKIGKVDQHDKTDPANKNAKVYETDKIGQTIQPYQTKQIYLIDCIVQVCFSNLHVLLIASSKINQI